MYYLCFNASNYPNIWLNNLTKYTCNKICSITLPIEDLLLTNLPIRMSSLVSSRNWQLTRKQNSNIEKLFLSKQVELYLTLIRLEDTSPTAANCTSSTRYTQYDVNL